MSFSVPVKDMLFAMEHLANLDQVAQIPGFEDANLETAQAVLEECAKLCEGVIEPLNIAGDMHPSSLKDGVVTTTAGFKEAFAQFAEGGWQGLQHPVDFGGQGLPKTIGAACLEMLNSANLSFALCPLLTDGAIEALLMAGSDELKAIYLEKLISGQWTGTMNLTEPQAGSDLSLVRTKAEPLPDGSYKIFGTKIFITYGEHDMAENIVHLVLARVAGAPEGVKGISLFVVPKFLVNNDGSLGARNDAHCVSIEHKMGIKASPTAVLQFGDHGGAIGYLVGEENRGLEYMFIMMNAARYGVGVQGIAVAERERVFDPFYRTLGSEQTGSGLGLCIVQAIAQRLGAQVRLAFSDEAAQSGLCVAVFMALAPPPPGDRARMARHASGLAVQGFSAALTASATGAGCSGPA